MRQLCKVLNKCRPVNALAEGLRKGLEQGLGLMKPQKKYKS
jgi:hypothetical protein